MHLKVSKDHYAHVPHYHEESVELEMYDVDKFPPMKVWDDSLKYVFATVIGKVFPWARVGQRQVDKVYQKMCDYMQRVCKDEAEFTHYLRGVNEMWPEFSEKMKNNRGLWKFMMDVGAESLSFARFPATLVPRAIALESAFGRNYDNAGVFRVLDDGCISSRCATVEPEFVELRRRKHLAQDTIFAYIPELRRYRDKPAPQKIATVVTLGAGLLAELRSGKMTLPMIQSLHIIACDMDTTIKDELDVVFQYDYGVTFNETGIEYRFCKLEDVLADKALRRRVKIVFLDGVLSYCSSVEKMQRYIEQVEALLESDGVIMCDLTVLDPSLVRCAVVQEWKTNDKDFKMRPELSANKAIKKIERICNNLNFDMKYEVDLRNPNPLGVVFWIKGAGEIK